MGILKLITTGLQDIVKEIVLIIFDETNITNIPFWKWFVTFVVIYVVIRAYMYVVGGDD